ncbi:hypothetical protein A7326_20700 [Stenotrophomonas maltophilia]|nr:hypothetical protein A7326_20700 [Stenotrophomonas maltophilia]
MIDTNGSFAGPAVAKNGIHRPRAGRPRSAKVRRETGLAATEAVMPDLRDANAIGVANGEFQSAHIGVFSTGGNADAVVVQSIGNELVGH